MHSIVDSRVFYQEPRVSEFTTSIGTGVDYFMVTYEQAGNFSPEQYMPIDNNLLLDLYNINQVVFTLEPGVEDNDCFEIQVQGIQAQLITKITFDYEVKNSYTVRVTATDQNSNSIQQSFTIYVTNSHFDVNLPPTDFFFNELTAVPDNSQSTPSRRFVGNFRHDFWYNNKVIEPDTDPTGYLEYPHIYYHYSLVEGEGSDDNNNFDLSNGAVLWTSQFATFNYAEKPQHSIRVKIQDPYGGSFEKIFTINVAANVVVLNSQVIAITNAGTAVATVNVNPITIEVTINGQPLPSGSVLRNSLTNQKFVKIEGGVKSFLAIEIEPKNSWAFTPTGNAAWEILQAL